MTFTSNLRPQAKLNVRLALASTCAALMLTACAPRMATLPTYDQNHKITVAETVERLELYVRPQGLNLSARDRSAMQGFVNLYGKHGDGGLYLNVPSNTAGAPGMRQAQAEIKNLLMRAGHSNAPIQMGRYNVAPNAGAPLVLSFRRLTIEPIDCEVGRDLTHTSNNQPYYSFGCAQQSNFAAMIGDPQQLIEPYNPANPNAARRTIGFDKYVAGTDTSSDMPARQQVSVGDN